METLNTILKILEPIITLLVITVGPILVTLITARLSTLLSFKSDTEKANFEKAVSDAIHRSAVNGLKYAATRAGIDVLKPDGTISKDVLLEASKYVQDKNPESLKKLGVDGGQLIDLLIAHAPEVDRVLKATK